MKIRASAQPAPFVPDGVDLSVLQRVQGRLGLAVSGGGDSVALTVLLTELFPRDYVLLTVDHGLRPEARADADSALALANRLGLPGERLLAQSVPRGSLQDWARSERHTLFRDAARRHGLAAIVLAHTLDDQAETFLLRLARGSGVRGLAAMAPDTTLDGLRLLRPLLGVSREALRKALEGRAIAWREDPSNSDPRFDRIAMRTLLPRLAAVGISTFAIGRACEHLRRAADVEDASAATLCSAGMWDRAGAFHVSSRRWAQAPADVRSRALWQLVRRIGRAPRAPSFAAIVEADRRMCGGGATALGRTRIATRNGRAVLWREARDLRAVPLAAGNTALFAGRWRVTSARNAPPVTIAPLGALRPPCAASVWRPALATTPALYANDALVAVPNLGVRDRRLVRGVFTITEVD